MDQQNERARITSIFLATRAEMVAVMSKLVHGFATKKQSVSFSSPMQRVDVLCMKIVTFEEQMLVGESPGQ